MGDWAGDLRPGAGIGSGRGLVRLVGGLFGHRLSRDLARHELVPGRAHRGERNGHQDAPKRRGGRGPAEAPRGGGRRFVVRNTQLQTVLHGRSLRGGHQGRAGPRRRGRRGLGGGILYRAHGGLQDLRFRSEGLRWPCWIRPTRSISARALGRWAMTMAMPPRARTPRIADFSASSPWESRLEFGSSRTTRNGSPNRARARPMRWRWPAERAMPCGPISVW